LFKFNEKVGIFLFPILQCCQNWPFWRQFKWIVVNGCEASWRKNLILFVKKKENRHRISRNILKMFFDLRAFFLGPR
jgi:hypothetical protein